MKKKKTSENISTETPVEKAPKKSKKKMIVTICFCVGTLAIGATLGTILGKLFFGGQAFDYSSIDTNGLYDDQEALMKRYNDIKNKASIQTYVDTFTPYELANIGLNRIAEHDYHYLVGTGLVNAMGVKQTIRSFAIKDQEKYFFENISKSSIVQVAKRFYQEGENIDTYNGKATAADKATWDENSKKSQTISEYAADWGRDMTVPTVYVISSKTTFDTSTTIVEGNRITVSLDLDPAKSVVNYVKQMKMTSDLAEYPVFYTVNFQVVLDETLTLLETHATEKYQVLKGVWASATGTLDEIHHYDEQIEIPDLNTDCNY